MTSGNVYPTWGHFSRVLLSVGDLGRIRPEIGPTSTIFDALLEVDRLWEISAVFGGWLAQAQLALSPLLFSDIARLLDAAQQRWKVRWGEMILECVLLSPSLEGVAASSLLPSHSLSHIALVAACARP